MNIFIIKHDLIYHVSEGNTKTGIPSFNTLPGKIGEKYNGYTPKKYKHLTECGGTCNCNCEGCYFKRATRYNYVFFNTWENTQNVFNEQRGGMFDGLKEAIKIFINKKHSKYFRIHDGGDFFSLEYLIAWDTIARENKDTRFYTYTKRLDLLKAFREQFGRDPAFKIQLSTWPGYCDLADIEAAGLEKYPRFEYDDNTRDELKKVKHCPAVNCSGKRTGIQCKQCGHCANAKSGQVWAVYAH